MECLGVKKETFVNTRGSGELQLPGTITIQAVVTSRKRPDFGTED